ncbi:DUF2637 domain-containing protein [Streptomyces rimosus]|uniref:DUF2637 domain-containing protein n=1 Tax=Streptomyces rimosus TaxID=1927 RepID=UPI0007C85B8F
MTQPPTALAVAPIGSWDRLAIIALGAAGCALSYDALQQMAVAIHVRGFLTYLFPLVIDGFIAYGVRALLVLSAAPLRARLYVWTLFGTATFASIWANALHAVRLNQQTNQTGLRLGDMVVTILSTLAPLALAGAVHLYILITRHHPADRSTRTSRTADRRTETAARRGTPRGARTADQTVRQTGMDCATADQPSRTGLPDHSADRQTASAPDSHASRNRLRTSTVAQTKHPAPTVQADGRTRPASRHRTASSDAAGHPADSAPAARAHGWPDSAEESRADQPSARSADRQGASTPDQSAGWSADHATGPAPDHSNVRSAAQADAPDPDQPSGQSARQAGPGPDRTTAPSADRTTGPNPDRSEQNDKPTAQTGTGDPVPLSVLLPIARQAALEEGRMTRAALRPYLRERNIPISNERFRELQERLYTDQALAHLPRPKRKSQ